jgi:hypothetical protein
MPNLHKHKSQPISLFVPRADANDHPSNGGTLYAMEKMPDPEKGNITHPSNQFEAFVCGTGIYEDMWHLFMILPTGSNPTEWSTPTSVYPLHIIVTCQHALVQILALSVSLHY